jgi:hypothetical protein
MIHFPMPLYGISSRLVIHMVLFKIRHLQPRSTSATAWRAPPRRVGEKCPLLIISFSGYCFALASDCVARGNGWAEVLRRARGR